MLCQTCQYLTKRSSAEVRLAARMPAAKPFRPAAALLRIKSEKLIAGFAGGLDYAELRCAALSYASSPCPFPPFSPL